MVPYKYDYRIYLLAEALDNLRNQVKELNQPKPLGYIAQPQRDYTRIFNENFQDVANYYNLTTNEQKLDLLNYIITHNFYVYYEGDEYDDDFLYPESITMSEFASNRIWDVISKHISCYQLMNRPYLI